MLLKTTLNFLVLLIVTTGVAFAQPGDPGGDPDAVPIPGLIYLVLGGAALGIYKIRQGFNRKANR